MNASHTIRFQYGSACGEKALMLDDKKYRRDIQALRGLAVLAVVLFHANESYFPLGYLGVDVFFVISGYVVTPLILTIFTHQAGGGRLSRVRYFYMRRFYRLGPALAMMLSISAILIFLLGPISDLQSFAIQGIATLLLAGNVSAYKYSGDYFSPNPNPLVHTWSLSVEEQIYIFLPIILILIIRNPKNLKKSTASLFVGILALSFAIFQFPTTLEPIYSLAGIELASQFSFYSPIDRIWQFIVGGLAFLALDGHQDNSRRLPKGIHLLTVISLLIILFGSFHINLKVSSILATLLTVILVIFKSLDSVPDFLIAKLEWVGNRSYSIYLVHMPLAYLAKHSPLIQIGAEENRIIQTLIVVVASILLGALIYLKIENKYRNRGKRKFAESSGTLKLFASVFIGPLIIFFLILSSLGTTRTSMYNDRFDNGICKFWTPNIDDSFYSRFLDCHSKFGPATVILGDSHAMNIYNSLFLKTKSEFFVGIAAAGCRPNTQSDSCHYDDFEALLKSSPSLIQQVFFHQSGSHLISDNQGNVDTDFAFQSQYSYSIVNNDIQFLIRYLNKMGKIVPTIWIGPFSELRVESTWVQVKTNTVRPNPIVKKAFIDLEKQISFYLEKYDKRFGYLSLLRILGDRQFDYRIGSCNIFRDVDHWSKCGEEIFSSQINKSLEK